MDQKKKNCVVLQRKVSLARFSFLNTDRTMAKMTCYGSLPENDSKHESVKGEKDGKDFCCVGRLQLQLEMEWIEDLPSFLHVERMKAEKTLQGGLLQCEKSGQRTFSERRVSLKKIGDDSSTWSFGLQLWDRESFIIQKGSTRGEVNVFVHFHFFPHWKISISSSIRC